jgi:hypothetical protein
MPVLSHLHQLFCAETCQDYIHTLRYAAVERWPVPMSPVPKPRRPSLGPLPLSARVETLLVQRLSAHLQWPHPHALRPEPAVVSSLDLGHLSIEPVLLISSHCQGCGCAYPHQLSLVLVVAQCGLVL